MLLGYDSSVIKESQGSWSSCVFGYFVDYRMISVTKINQFIREHWATRGHILVHRMADFCVFKCSDERDKNDIMERSIAVFDGALMVFKDWLPNTPPQSMSFREAKVWIRVYGLPFEYLNNHIASLIGRMFEENCIVSNYDSCTENDFLRIQVLVHLDKPLIPGFYLALHDGSLLWVQFKYEEIIKVCVRCGQVGHKINGCRETEENIKNSIDALMTEVLSRGFPLVQAENTFLRFKLDLKLNSHVSTSSKWRLRMRQDKTYRQPGVARSIFPGTIFEQGSQPFMGPVLQSKKQGEKECGETFQQSSSLTHSFSSMEEVLDTKANQGQTQIGKQVEQHVQEQPGGDLEPPDHMEVEAPVHVPEGLLPNQQELLSPQQHPDDNYQKNGAGGGFENDLVDIRNNNISWDDSGVGLGGQPPRVTNDIMEFQAVYDIERTQANNTLMVNIEDSSGPKYSTSEWPFFSSNSDSGNDTDMYFEVRPEVNTMLELNLATTLVMESSVVSNHPCTAVDISTSPDCSCKDLKLKGPVSFNPNLEIGIFDLDVESPNAGPNARRAVCADGDAPYSNAIYEAGGGKGSGKLLPFKKRKCRSHMDEGEDGSIIIESVGHAKKYLTQLAKKLCSNDIRNEVSVGMTFRPAFCFSVMGEDVVCSSDDGVAEVGLSKPPLDQ